MLRLRVLEPAAAVTTLYVLEQIGRGRSPCGLFAVILPVTEPRARC